MPFRNLMFDNCWRLMPFTFLTALMLFSMQSFQTTAYRSVFYYSSACAYNLSIWFNIIELITESWFIVLTVPEDRIIHFHLYRNVRLIPVSCTMFSAGVSLHVSFTTAFILSLVAFFNSVVPFWILSLCSGTHLPIYRDTLPSILDH